VWRSAEPVALHTEHSGSVLKDYSPHFRQLVEDNTPDGARVLMPRGPRDMVILTTWPLNDPKRPAKRSRMMRIMIIQEAIDDYARGDEELRRASDARFCAWLHLKLNAFDPNHDSPLGVEPAPVTWNMSTVELNGQFSSPNIDERLLNLD
jgi:hypothetical protein